MNWAKSKGGPLILMERQLLSDWHGCYTQDGTPSFDNSLNPTDYDRAVSASMEKYISNISVGKGNALVFTYPPLMGTFLQTTKNGMFYFITIDDTDETVIQSIDLKDALWVNGEKFLLSSDEVVVFDSASRGSYIRDGEDVAEYSIPRGNYLVEMVEIESIFANVHRFSKT